MLLVYKITSEKVSNLISYDAKCRSFLLNENGVKLVKNNTSFKSQNDKSVLDFLIK
jgi:hypothetical protein